MKTVSKDQTYVDYAAGNIGVRVRENICRPIIVERGRWVEYGVSYSIPVGIGHLHSKSTGISSLASNVKHVEESGPGGADPSELRRLITGEIRFEDVIALQPGRKPAEFSREAQPHPAVQSA